MWKDSSRALTAFGPGGGVSLWFLLLIACDGNADNIDDFHCLQHHELVAQGQSLGVPPL